MVNTFHEEQPSLMFDFRFPPTPKIDHSDTASQVIDRGSPIPLHHQLYRILLKRIEADEWKPDGIIPTEKELGKAYDLSRTTVRQTLQQLVSEGYLYRRKGQGTFLSKPKIRHGPQRPFGITGYMRAKGLEPGWRLLSMARVTPPTRVATALGLKAHEEVLEIGRLRLANQEIIGVHTVYVPFPLAERIRPEHMVQGDSSLSYLEDALGILLSESHRVLQATLATQTEAELLDVDARSPLFLVQRVTISADGIPVEYLNAAYRGDRFEYYVHTEH